MIDAKYFQEIQAREQAATPGPLEVITVKHRSKRDTFAVSYSNYGTEIRLFEVSDNETAQFFARARTDIPALIEQHEQDQQKISTLEKQLEMSIGIDTKSFCPMLKIDGCPQKCKDCRNPRIRMKSCWREYFLQLAQKEGQK